MHMIPVYLLFVACPAVLTRHVGELLCRRCGATVTRQSEIINVTSSEAKLKYKYEFDVVGKTATVQVVENPAGEKFHMLMSKTAHLKYHGHPSSDASWFPGMKWTICVCSQCSQHMGWHFQHTNEELQSSDKNDGFVGLVLDHLISADHADTLMKTPK